MEENIKVTTLECHGISNNWQLDCLFNNFLPNKKHQSSTSQAFYMTGLHQSSVIYNKNYKIEK